MKKIITLIGLLLLFVATMPVSAASLPARNNRYVNDNANVLSSTELSQLRTDVKSMCDYYKYQIAVCIVPSFNGMGLDDYASAVGQNWGVTNSGDNGLLILIKPKSNSGNGEAKLLASPDLSGKLSSSTLKKILQQEMLPHLRNNEYYNSVEAALMYLNDLPQMVPSASETVTTSNDVDDYSNTEQSRGQAQNGLGGGFMKWIPLLIGAVILIFLLKKMKGVLNKMKVQKGTSNDNTSSSTQTQNQQPKAGRPEGTGSNTPNTDGKPNIGNRTNTDGKPNIGNRTDMDERPNTVPYSTENTNSNDGDQSLEEMIREIEAERHSMSNDPAESHYVTDLNSGLPQDMEDELKQYFTGSHGAIDEKTLEDILKKMATRQGNGTSMVSMAKKALKVALSVGAGVVVIKMLKKMMGAGGNSDEDGGLLGKIIKGNKNDDDNAPASNGTKPDLGGKRPNLGNKSDEGSSASVSW